MSEQNVQVTRADREAAWPIWKWLFGDAADEAHFMDGDEDDHFVVQAFARHRTRTEPDLVEVLNAIGQSMLDDYQTSEMHHPNHVLVPIAAFDRLRAALTRADV